MGAPREGVRTGYGALSSGVADLLEGVVVTSSRHAYLAAYSWSRSDVREAAGAEGHAVAAVATVATGPDHGRRAPSDQHPRATAGALCIAQRPPRDSRGTDHPDSAESPATAARRPRS
jgi:hypothetical protein